MLLQHAFRAVLSLFPPIRIRSKLQLHANIFACNCNCKQAYLHANVFGYIFDVPLNRGSLVDAELVRRVEQMVDREREAAELAGLLRRRGPVLALLHGRRRVGKTFLLNHIWPEEQTFYFVASDATGELNRLELLAELGRWLG